MSNKFNDPFSEPRQSTLYASENLRTGSFEYETLSSYTTKTFLWMFAGLLATFAVALVGYTSGIGMLLLRSSGVFFALAIAEVVVVMVMVSRLHKISVTGARMMFFAYAVLNGLVFSSYFWVYDLFELVMAFGATALYFGIMAAYGYFTKKDLSGWAKPLMFGLIAMLIVSVLGMLFGMGGGSILMCCVGIILFACYTAYDTQKIKAAYFAYAGNEELAKKASIYAALELYLDFINLFLYILRIFARSNRN